MIKITDLINNIDASKNNLAELIDVNYYIPIEVKKAIAQEIVYESTFEEYGIPKVDSFERYMSFVRHMVREHTNLDYTDEDYDALCSTAYGDCSLLDAIMSLFGADAKECSRILDMVTGDKMQDAALETVLAKTLNELGGKFEKIGSMLTQKADDMMPDGVNMNMLSDFLKNYTK